MVKQIKNGPVPTEGTYNFPLVCPYANVDQKECTLMKFGVIILIGSEATRNVSGKSFFSGVMGIIPAHQQSTGSNIRQSLRCAESFAWMFDGRDYETMC